jgi:hypothetical protein
MVMPNYYDTHAPETNYYDDMLAQILWSQKYPRGEYEWLEDERTGRRRKVPVPETYQTSEDRRGAKMKASQRESDMLGYLLGSERAATRSDKPGRYAMAEYPELWFATQGASQGLTPYGSGGIGQWLADLQTPGGGQRRDKERKDWARQQERILGRGGKEMSRSMAEKLSWMNRKRQLGRRR